MAFGRGKRGDVERLSLPDLSLAVDIVRTGRRKTVGIHILDGRVEVRAPGNISLRRIEAVVKKHTGWIRRKIASRPPVPVREFVDGAVFPCLGREYRLTIIEGNEGDGGVAGGDVARGVMLRDDALVVCLGAGRKNSLRGELGVRALVEGWYRAEAEAVLLRKTADWAGVMAVMPGRVRVRAYRARWGSCSAGGDISYNWRLVMAPEGIVDYVVVHELCHLVEHNHSRAYWRVVERFMPDYKARRKWLRENQTLFVF